MSKKLSEKQIELLQSALGSGVLTTLDLVIFCEARIRSIEKFMAVAIEPKDIELKAMYDKDLAQTHAKLFALENIHWSGEIPERIANSLRYKQLQSVDNQ
jgi:hypothetical protein